MNTESEQECTNGETESTDASDNKIACHPAFFEAIQMELDEYRDTLQFISEYQLTTEPLRIDVVIIKKTADVLIKKNIARMFRKDNIIEYKSPTDYVSASSFHRVCAYAHLYIALNSARINDITLTFVESSHPRKLINYLTEQCSFHVEETAPGIYTRVVRKLQLAEQLPLK